MRNPRHSPTPVTRAALVRHLRGAHSYRGPVIGRAYHQLRDLHESRDHDRGHYHGVLRPHSRVNVFGRILRGS